MKYEFYHVYYYHICHFEFPRISESFSLNIIFEQYHNYNIPWVYCHNKTHCQFTHTIWRQVLDHHSFRRTLYVSIYHCFIYFMKTNIFQRVVQNLTPWSILNYLIDKFRYLLMFFGKIKIVPPTFCSWNFMSTIPM